MLYNINIVGGLEHTLSLLRPFDHFLPNYIFLILCLILQILQFPLVYQNGSKVEI